MKLSKRVRLQDSTLNCTFKEGSIVVAKASLLINGYVRLLLLQKVMKSNLCWLKLATSAKKYQDVARCFSLESVAIQAFLDKEISWYRPEKKLQQHA